MSNGPPQSSASSIRTASSIRSLRKRHSFFGRSSSDASRARKPNGYQPSPANQDIREEQALSRPTTALSTDTHRSTTETLVSIRNSIFGGRKNLQSPEPIERTPSNTSQLSSRDGAAASAVPNWSRQHFSTKEDYDRYLTKSSISPPFNFQHVTHTDKTRLPQLETVNEKDLPGHFWSEAAYQRPRKHLNGIKAEDLQQKHRQMGITRGSPSSRPTTPVSPIAEEPPRIRPITLETIESVGNLDETMFDEVKETRFSPDDGLRTLEPPSLEPAKQVLRYPKRFSSLNALNEMLHPPEPIHEQPTTFYESNSSNASCEAEIREESQNLDQEPLKNSAIPQNNFIDTTESSEDDIAYRAKQPLPPLPNQKPTKKPSTSSLTSKFPTPPSNLSLVIPAQTQSSPKSKSSTRSSQSARKSFTLSSSNDTRRSASLSDATWEDDVDFCYEQAAESTCDFNWDVVGHPQKPLLKSEDSLSPLESSYHAYSPISNGSGSSFRFNGSTETIAERRRSRAAVTAGHHKRGSSSVGHRGFLAARKSSSDLTAMVNSTPAQSDATQAPAQVSILSPVFSVTAADNEPHKGPFVPGMLHYPGFDAGNTVYLSDPESRRDSNSSKHRKSSSYGSHESAARPVANTRPTNSANRWSVASASSVPELTHSRPPKGKLFLSKTIISAPLETLPQSPPMAPEMDFEESTIIPRELQRGAVRSSFLMRRPQSPGDRAVLQASGKVVQLRGGRSATPSRSSRLILTPSPDGMPRAATVGPEWI